MTKMMPVSAWQFTIFMVLVAGVVAVSTSPALAAGTINLSPITNILVGIAATLTGPLGKAMATLAVIGIGAAWLMGYVQFDKVVYVIAGIAIIAGAATIVNTVWGK